MGMRETDIKMAAIFENGRFRRPFWNFAILNILISFRMSIVKEHMNRY